MSPADVAVALALAAVSMYGLGVPAAWLLPAPSSSPWAYRIAIGPLYGILVATVGAWVLGRMGVPLHPAQLLGLVIGAWGIAFWRTRAEWRIRSAARGALGPVVIVVSASAVWAGSLQGYGLYLPNRDFKNHAYFIAQVAVSRSSEAAHVLRDSPISTPAGGSYYPLGLHTLLGWSLPTPEFNTLGVAAAAALLATTVSMPLALVALSRMLVANDRLLWWLAGLTAVLLPGLTSSFGIGSVVLLVSTSLYCASLVTLWHWLRQPSKGSSFALGVALLGLLALHLAEALGLALVAVVALVVAAASGRLGEMSRAAVFLAGAALAAVLAITIALFLRLGLAGLLRRPVDTWDVEPNAFNPLSAAVAAVVNPIGGPAFVGVFWATALCVGVFLVVRRRLDLFPLVALGAPLALSVIASSSGIPTWLRLATSPWFGSIDRLSLMLGAPAALIVCVTAATAIRSTWGTDVAADRPSALRGTVVIVVAGALLVSSAFDLVASRRSDLRAVLAGTGDTVALAVELSRQLRPGETVLNFEGDGTANLFAAARVPVVSAHGTPSDSEVDGADLEWLTRNLMNLSDSRAREAMSDLGVGYIAMGTTSMYWGSEPAYAPWRLLGQPQLSPFAEGSDMVVFRYHPEVP